MVPCDLRQIRVQSRLYVLRHVRGSYSRSGRPGSRRQHVVWAASAGPSGRFSVVQSQLVPHCVVRNDPADGWPRGRSSTWARRSTTRGSTPRRTRWHWRISQIKSKYVRTFANISQELYHVFFCRVGTKGDWNDCVTSVAGPARHFAEVKTLAETRSVSFSGFGNRNVSFTAHALGSNA